MAYQQHKTFVTFVKPGTELKLVSSNMQNCIIWNQTMHQLEMNVEVNGLHENDTTFLWTQNSGMTTRKQEGCLSGINSASSRPLWNALGAKPKNKSFPWEMGGWVIARAKHPEICDATGWPALPSRQSAWSTPVLSRTQPWIAAKGRTSNKPPEPPCAQLELEQICTAAVRPQSMIGISFAKYVKGWALRTPKYTAFVRRISRILAAHPTMEWWYCETIAQSEVLKQDFTDLLNSSLSTSSTCLSVALYQSQEELKNSADCRLSTACTLHQCTWLTISTCAETAGILSYLFIYFEGRWP